VLAAGRFTGVGLCRGTGLGSLVAGRVVPVVSGFLGTATGFLSGLTGFLLLGCGFGWGLWLLDVTAAGFHAVGLARRAAGLPGLWMGFATGRLLGCLRPLRAGFLRASTRRLCAYPAASGCDDRGQSKPWLSRSDAG